MPDTWIISKPTHSSSLKLGQDMASWVTQRLHRLPPHQFSPGLLWFDLRIFLGAMEKGWNEKLIFKLSFHLQGNSKSAGGTWRRGKIQYRMC